MSPVCRKSTPARAVEMERRRSHLFPEWHRLLAQELILTLWLFLKIDLSVLSPWLAPRGRFSVLTRWEEAGREDSP